MIIQRQTVTLTLTKDEVSTLKRLLIREERMLENLLTVDQVEASSDVMVIAEEAAELTALRMKIHDQQ